MYNLSIALNYIFYILYYLCYLYIIRIARVTGRAREPSISRHMVSRKPTNQTRANESNFNMTWTFTISLAQSCVVQGRWRLSMIYRKIIDLNWIS